jgi:aspartate carbamoyltransferase catalytic subunit
MKHLITTADFSKKTILKVFEDAKKFLKTKPDLILKDKLIITLFFENSTRTRSSFEVAAKHLGASVIHLDVAKSSTKKGESLLDTATNLDSMGPNAIIVRHKHSGVPQSIAQHINASILNAGDGAHAHPTQALLDLFTIMQHYPKPEGKRIAIVGDIKNSRVANSNIELLSRFGLDITLVAPPHFLPKTDLKTSYSLKSVIDNIDIIMSLRTQTERHNQPTYGSLKDIYLFIIISTLPISIIGEEIMQVFGQTYPIVVSIGYLGGLIQWVLIVGGLIDRFLPKINFNIKISTLIITNRYIFILGFFGFFLSIITIQKYYISSIVYNISLALVVCTIGIKILYLEKK